MSVQWFLTPLARISSSDSQRLQPRNRKEDDKPGLLRWFLWLNHSIISWKPSLSTQKQFSELKTTAINDFTYHLWAPWPFTWEFTLARVLLALLSMMLFQMANCTILMFRISEQRRPFSPFLSFTANTISLSVQRDAVQDSSSDIIAALLPGLQRALRDWLHGKAERSHLWATVSLEIALHNTANKKWAPFRLLYKSSHFMVEITSCTGCLRREH